MADSKVRMDFNKKNISKNVAEYLEELIQDEDQKNDLRRIIRGNKLQYNEANKLLRNILEAMMKSQHGEYAEKEQDVVSKSNNGPD